jgi:hypothetical protein
MQIVKIMIIGTLVAFVVVLGLFLILKNKLKKNELRQVKYAKGSKKSSSETTYQKLYLYYKKIPFVNRYMNKLRRRIEIINLRRRIPHSCRRRKSNDKRFNDICNNCLTNILNFKY